MTLQEKVEYALKNGRGNADKLVTQLLQHEHRQAWDKAMQEEYDKLFLEDIEYTETQMDDEGNEVEVVKVKQEYSLTAPIYEDWLNETRVINGAVEEVSHIEVIDGVETKIIDIEAVAEITELVRPYVPMVVTPTELSAQMNQYGFYKKVARGRIEKEVGDDKDLLADISKRLALNERLLMRLTNELLPTLAADGYVAQAYGGMIAQYLAGVDGGVIKDRADYEDTAILFGGLIVKTNKIGEIVNEEYLSKKV
jgi:hypothetical protein